jgi:hypothetical protein
MASSSDTLNTIADGPVSLTTAMNVCSGYRGSYGVSLLMIAVIRMVSTTVVEFPATIKTRLPF